MTHGGDIFDTATLREATLQSWLASATRLREDTNAEAELASEGYRAAIIWELLQNAYDAARQDLTPCAWVTLEDGASPYLEVSNSGVPLTPAGVASLASLRASTKARTGRAAVGEEHTGAIGRFGVGFAAVRSVSDHVDVISTTAAGPAGISFNLQRLATVLQDHSPRHPHIADVLETCADDLPALRWPEPLEVSPRHALAAGATTTVRVWLRDEAAVAAVRNQLEKIDERLLLAMPFDRLTISAGARREYTKTDLESRWFLYRETHELPAELTHSLPTAQRRESQFEVVWGVPREHDLPREGRVVWAPTPTLDELNLNAILVTAAPVNAMREHIRDDPTATFVARAAGSALAAFAEKLTKDGRNDLALGLLPTGFTPNRFSTDLFETAREELRSAAIVPTVSGQARSAREAVAVASRLTQEREFADLACEAGFENLTTLDPNSGAAAFFGFETVSLAEVIEQLPTVRVQWRERFETLQRFENELRSADALGALAVPLADGRVVRGCRGVTQFVLHEADQTAARLDDETLHTLQVFGVRLLDPDAYHPLLETLGLMRLNVLQAIAGDFGRNVCATITASFEDGDEDEAEELSDMLLRLVKTALPERPDPEILPLARVHLLNLVVEDVTGDLAPLRNSCLPGSPALEYFDDDWLTIVADESVARYGAAALAWCGATRSVPLLDLVEMLSEHSGEPWAHAVSEALDDEVVDVEAWLEHTQVKGAYPESVVLRDANQVRDSAWPQVLTTAAEVLATLRGGPREAAIGSNSYILWWVGEDALDGQSLVPADATENAWMASLERFDIGIGVAPQWAATLPEWAKASLNLGGTLASVLDSCSVDDVLDALSMPPEEFGGVPESRAVMALWHRAVAALRAGEELAEPPEELWVLTSDSRCEFVPTQSVNVAGAPMWLQRTDLEPLVLVALDSDAAALISSNLQCADVAMSNKGRVLYTAAPDTAQAAIRAHARTATETLILLGNSPLVSVEVIMCETLTSDDHPVGWWVAVDGGRATVYGVTSRDIAFGVASAQGCWQQRFMIQAIMAGQFDAMEATRELVITEIPAK